ncbi:MAG: ribosomal protein S18 [Candidatus Xenolissoclinum pacificiensis L6]|uniref:Ribosomal protein S18 n=1 Tax=Candidatus Xenolissoclinum pacificiensis L6 TaxID=1401685 RepID=W2UYV2_9RICK|nr:MAG: ribosomal protein S18 [Candidatus Xenolissoclinum pacificiensis L6]
MNPLKEEGCCTLNDFETKYIDYKNVAFLKKYSSPCGRIMPGKINGLCPRHQRLVRKALQIARMLGFVAFCSRNKR